MLPNFETLENEIVRHRLKVILTFKLDLKIPPFLQHMSLN